MAYHEEKGGDEMAGRTINLTEREATILRDICFARMKVLHAGDPESCEDLPLHSEVIEVVARMTLPVFDFFQCAWHGNEEGVKRLVAAQHAMGPHAGCEYYGGMIPKYQEMMINLMGESYTPDDIAMLQARMKGFIKSMKAPVPRTLYISDCHFFHRRLNTEMDRRGFTTIEEMNDHMIQQWNRKVNSRDEVYILGDFSLAGGFQTSEILECLNGKKHLIIGNHDDRYLKDKRFEIRHLHSCEYYMEIRDKGRKVILLHYPIFCYKGQYHHDKQGNSLTYMLYGHVHNTHDERLINRFIMETRETKVISRYAQAPESIPCNMINCFCMFSDYQPMTLDEWIEIDGKRREKMNGIECFPGQPR